MICDACRLRSAMEHRVGNGLADGSLHLPDSRSGWFARLFQGPGRTSLDRTLAWSGGLAVAASLLLMFLMPPQARDGDRISRSADQAQFKRPVEGEVLASDHPRLSWEAIPGATSYRITVNEVAGSYTWQGETTELSIEIPAAAAMPGSGDFRAFLEPVPTDLAQPGGITVSFRTGEFGTYLGYRFMSAGASLKIFGLIGLAMFLGAGGRGLARIIHE